MPVWHFERPPIPARAILYSFASLLAPVIAAFFGDGQGPELLVWMTALVPAFMLAYYRGWQGAATALAAGMAALAVSQALLAWTDVPAPRGLTLLALIAVYTASCLGAGILGEKLHAQRAHAEELALTDDLTNVPNRRRVRRFLEAEFGAAEKGRALSVVLFDLDAFKRYNDTHGHAAGDVAIQNFARALRSATGPRHMSARYGGEEFLAVLPRSTEAEALGFVERVRSSLQTLHPSETPLTVSAGVALYERNMLSPSELIVAADQALYEAKLTGRDAVRVFRGEITALS